jgi:hypothetical protein
MVFRPRKQTGMNLLRFILAVFLFFMLAVLLVNGNFIVLAASAVASFLALALQWRDLRICFWRAVPVLLFCAILAVLEWIAHRSLTLLELKTIVCYAILSLVVRIMPWAVMTRLVSPQSRFFTPVLFLFFVFHFTAILQEETRRALTAYRLAVPHPYRRGGIGALAHCLDSLFRRCLARAERFYAAQSLRGFAE